MTRLSSAIQDLRARYDAVVVGSGYGGGVAASRLARAGRSVCLLERGRELQPGEYPDTPREAARELQLDLPRAHLGSPTGLYDIRVNDDINVVLGCGLGGTSLINANVALEADPRVFDDPVWPAALRADLAGGVQRGYEHARQMLRPTPYPRSAPTLPKLEALEDSARQVGAAHRRLPICVNFERLPGDLNHVGVRQLPCNGCGDCVSGCNYRAKNTTLMNYLPDARSHGAELYTGVQVRRVAREPDGAWRVYYQLLELGREKFDGPELFVSAEVVILGAGALGSTEILLRSRAAGLELSDQLGRRFSGNGDVLGFAYNCDQEVRGVGHGAANPEHREAVGPCITGALDLRERPQLESGFIIEEGSLPGALGSFLPALLAAAAKSGGRDTDWGLLDEPREHQRELESLLRGPDHGALRNTQTFLVMAHDGSDGRMSLENDRLRIRWPGVGARPIFREVDQALERATDALGGTFVPNPLWHPLLGQHLVTVHPLGGCPMGEDATSGVADHRGEVFRGTSGGERHRGLYVADGALLPRSVGVNPLLTISGLAERAVRLLAAERGWAIDERWPAPPPPRPEPKPGLRFTETMKGFLSALETSDFAAAASRGERDGSPCQFTLTIASDDVELMLREPEHEARAIGTVSAPALAREPLAVLRGVFHLNVIDPDDERGRLMLYRLLLRSTTGESFYFDGFKKIRDGAGFDLWSDTTTLYVSVYRGENRGAPLAARGILRIAPSDFALQLGTVQVTDAPDTTSRLRWVARFGEAFARNLFRVYGGVLATHSPFAPDAPARKQRELRAPAPELHAVRASDGVPLRLLRYRAGDKGPVLLSHGLGVSSRIYSTDTIDTNLLEYLCAHRYDVWLLDYRSSIELPSATAPATADDVALLDYPAAVQAVRSLSGAASAQLVVHCFGSTTFFMAMLGGLQGVRSAVASQIAAHIEAPPLSRAKAGLHLPELLAKLGVTSLTAQASEQANWFERLYDRALALQLVQPEELCTSASCHRIQFMYALLYEHDQLNAATHAALHELFGAAHTQQFEHLARMVRAGKLVGASGEDRYLPHLERLAIPIRFLHGAENACFAPESTAKTYRALRERNGRRLYTRHVIPGYGHIDCIFGKNAVRDVYPLILEHLEQS